jgi:SAM-dependent methyltransferase
MDKTRDFYNQFTYPFVGVKEHSNVGGDSIFYLFDLFSKRDGLKDQLFLDAGCGTGQRVLDIARHFKKAKFVGIDFSQSSIKIAKEQAEHDHIKNINFYCHNILTYQSKTKYSIINVNGVLHHIQNAGDVLKNLSSNLAEDGLLVAWCYHKYGEADRMINRDLLLTLLNEKKDDYQSGIELMKDMNMSISENRYGKSYGNALSKNDQLIKDADAFLNPYVRTFTFMELMRQIKDSGLDWIAVEQINFEDSGFLITLNENETKQFWVLNLKDHIKSNMAYTYYTSLSKLDKLHVIELLTKPTGFTVFAGTNKALARVPGRMRYNATPFASI